MSFGPNGYRHLELDWEDMVEVGSVFNQNNKNPIENEVG